MRPGETVYGYILRWYRPSPQEAQDLVLALGKEGVEADAEHHVVLARFGVTQIGIALVNGPPPSIQVHLNRAAALYERWVAETRTRLFDPDSYQPDKYPTLHAYVCGLGNFGQVEIARSWNGQAYYHRDFCPR